MKKNKIKKWMAGLPVLVLLTACSETDIRPEAPAEAQSSAITTVGETTAPEESDENRRTETRPENGAAAYTTPYGTFVPIPHILEINEYMVNNPSVLGSGSSMVYITPNGSREDAEEVMSTVKDLSDTICQQCTDDYSKAYALAVWTGTNVAYDHDAAHDMSDLTVTSLEAVINNGFRTTCGGFANLYSALCACQGIYCLNMKGGTSSEGWTRAQLEEAPANHEWNAVFIDGKWYYSDCTWISDLSYEDGEIYGGEAVLPFYALFGFGEMSVEHRIDRCEYRDYFG